jgi:hypothetical protein
MLARPIREDDIPTVNAWWDARDEGTMPAGVLPPCGVLVVDGETPVAAAWMYRPEGCKVGMIDWLVARPGMDAPITRKACRLAFTFLTMEAKRAGLSYLFASVSRAGMEQEALAVGFHVASTHNTHLVLPL